MQGAGVGFKVHDTGDVQGSGRKEAVEVGCQEGGEGLRAHTTSMRGALMPDGQVNSGSWPCTERYADV